ncbi:MAG: hypothetical protein PHC61_15805, partial [Chitinivibrionales bacterium]|nr:hypothetical protein [Chitinivibrionales bacterium]
MRLFGLQKRLLTSALLALLLCMPLWAAAPKDKKKDSWQIRETLTARLGSEWDKIGVLNRELANINDVLGDIRSFELYPPEV